MRRILTWSLLLLCGAMVGIFYPGEAIQAEQLLDGFLEFFPVEVPYHRALLAGDEKTLARFWHEDYLGWPTGEDLPWDKEFGLKTIHAWIEDHGGTLGSPMFEPIGASVVGDAGVVHYLLEYTVEMKDGTKSNRKVRISHFWIKEGGQWKLLGEAMASE